MDALFCVNWGNFVDKEENELFNLHALAPTDNFWYLSNNPIEKKELLLKYLKKYQKLLERHNQKHNLTFLKKIYENNSFLKNTERILVGCTVNISALCSTVNKTFDISKILYKEPNGCLYTNRQRNAASHICLRTILPTMIQYKKFDHILQKYNVLNSRTTDITDKNLNTKKTVGDKTTRINKTCQSNYETSKSSTSNSTNSKKNQDAHSLFNLLYSQNKPRDQTYLTYPSGSAVLTGAKEAYMALLSQWTLANLFTIEGIPITYLNNFSIQNIVATFRIPTTIDLIRLEAVWGDAQIRYTKIQFPAGIFTPEKKVIEMAWERANIIKQIRKEIIFDNSHKSSDDLKVDVLLDGLLSSYDSFKIKEKYERQNVIKSSSAQLDIHKQNIEKAKQHDPEFMEEMNQQILKSISNDISPIKISPGIDLGSNPVALIYRTGPIVITGSDDIDFEIALFEILYDMLMLFKNNCEEKDKIIADNCSNVINLDKLNNQNNNVKSLVLQKEIDDKNKKMIIQENKKTIGVAPKGSFMRKLSLLAKIDNIASNAEKATKVESSQVGYEAINKRKSNDNELLITHQKKPTTNNKLVKVKKRSAFTDLVNNNLKKHRN